MKTTKTKIIRNTLNDRLRLSKTRLLQIDHPYTVEAWYVTAGDLDRAYWQAQTSPSRESRVFIHAVGSPRIMHVSLVLSSGYRKLVGYWARIGCASFDEETFASILHFLNIRKIRAAKAGA